MKIARQHLLAIGLLCAVPIACAPAIPEKVGSVRNYNATFACEGDQRVDVHFIPFKATLEFQGASVDMDQQGAADGFLYSGGGQSLRANGDEAMWTDGKGAIHHCRETFAAAAH